MVRMTSRRQKRDFWQLFCCFEAVCLILVGLSAWRTVRSEKRSYLDAIHARTERVQVSMSQEFTGCVNTCNAIFSSTWYMHFRNHADLYAEEFTPLRRQEIIDDLRGKASAQRYLQNIAVITPSKDCVITGENWLSIRDYMSFYGVLDIDVGEDTTQEPIVTVVDPDYIAIVLSDVNRRYEAGVIVAVMSVKSIAASIAAQLDASCVYMRLLVGGKPVYGLGTPQRMTADGFSLSFPAVELQLGYLPYEQVLLKTCLMEHALLLILATFLSLGLSYVFMVLFYEPIRRLLTHFNLKGARVERDPFEEITGYMDSFRDQYRELAMERGDLAGLLERSSDLIRQEAVYGLLAGTQVNPDDRYVVSMFPWLRDRLPCVLALSEPYEPGRSAPAAQLEAEAERALHFYRLGRPDGSACMIYWYADRERAGAQRALLAEECARSRLPCILGVSEVLSDARELHEAYVHLKSRMEDEGRVERTTLPFWLTLGLMREIQLQRWDKCDALLREARDRYDVLSLLNLLRRIAEEYGVDFTEAEEYFATEPDEEAAWQALSRFVRRLGEAIHPSEEEDASEQHAVAILEYISEHADDPELCVNQLADRFGMHRTMITRLLKNHFGLSFTDYLLKLRIGKAQQMLRETDKSLSEIAELTGYGNYLTFKRAFIRYTGMLPKDFRSVRIEGEEGEE